MTRWGSLAQAGALGRGEEAASARTLLVLSELSNDEIVPSQRAVSPAQAGALAAQPVAAEEAAPAGTLVV